MTIATRKYLGWFCGVAAWAIGACSSHDSLLGGHADQYAIERAPDDDEFVATQRNMHLTARFRAGNVQVVPDVRAATTRALDLAPVAFGCEGTMLAMGAARPVVDASQPNRVEKMHTSIELSEWYVNGAAGLEQGFTIAKLPSCVHAGQKLIIRLAESVGWNSVVQDDGSKAVLTSATGSRLHYGQLSAIDAAGLSVGAKLVKGAAGLEIQLEGGHWAAPLRVDPLLWAEQSLTAVETLPEDQFGAAAAISGDTAVVGALWASGPGLATAGAAYTYARAGSEWEEQKVIKPPDPGAYYLFGAPVALDGTTLLVAALNSSWSPEAAYVFVRSGSAWNQQQKLTAPVTAGGFGTSLAVSGDTAVVGATTTFNSDGQAFIFARSGAVWAEQKRLTASDVGKDDEFGTAVSISGSTVIVGEPWQADGGDAYVYARSGTAWTQQQRLTASEAGNAFFGSSVSIDGDTAIVAAPSKLAAYVFVRSGTIWSVQQKLTGSDVVPGDGFGPVALLNNTAIVGAAGQTSETGAAYVFIRSGTTWSETRKLTAPDGAQDDYFGSAIALGTNTAIVGAYNKNMYTGAAYVFNWGFSPGDACSVNTDCLAGVCSAEAVCCDVSCSNPCQSCLAARKATGADGVCGDVASGTDPKNACALEAVSTCGTTGVCDGAGACTKYAAGNECAPASCPSSTSEKLHDTCNGSGICVAPATMPCKVGYACVAGACKASCSDDADCDGDGGYSCQAGACSKSALGAPCASDVACDSGFCPVADGVCCDSACDGTCQACLGAKTGGADGACGFALADTDPDDDCPASGGACAAPGLCDGSGSCRKYASKTTACGPTSCPDDANVQGQLCDGVGKCKNAETSCSPFVCAGSACTTTCKKDANCAPGAFCNAAKTCENKQANGTTCEATSECSSGFCADGVCCDQACDGQCEGCAEKGLKGSCSAVTGAPRGDRAACEGTAQCVDVTFTPAPECDGAGACATPAAVDCPGGYACSEQGCLTACSRDSDCAPGFGCDAGACARQGGKCSDDGAQALDDQNRVIEACSPYLCADGQCGKACQATTDCSDGFICNPANTKCETINSGSANSDGCSCRAAGGTTTSHWSSFALLLAGLAIRLRRRAPAPRPGEFRQRLQGAGFERTL